MVKRRSFLGWLAALPLVPKLPQEPEFPDISPLLDAMDKRPGMREILTSQHIRKTLMEYFPPEEGWGVDVQWDISQEMYLIGVTTPLFGYDTVRAAFYSVKRPVRIDQVRDWAADRKREWVVWG